MIIGKLKPIEFFLEKGWEQKANYIINSKYDYGIDKRRFGRELELIETNEPYYGLRLKDINDNTTYMLYWFEDLDEYDDVL